MKHKTFVIPKGRHEPRDKAEDGYVGKAKALEGYFELDRSFYYPRPNSSNDWMDISKLIGISQGNHLKNSWRIGFRPDYDRSKYIILYAFVHSKIPVTSDAFFNRSRQFSFVELGKVKVRNRYYFKIDMAGQQYVIKGGGQHIVLPIQVDRPTGILNNWGYLLNPYHGGNLRAPQEMKCRILWRIRM